MRMCSLCEANPVVSDGKCLACLKDAAGIEPETKPRGINRGRPKTPRGVRTSTPGWLRRREPA